MTKKSPAPSPTYADAQANIAIADPAHLKRWLQETGRRFLVMRTDDLVDSLPWPHGVEALIQIIEAYKQRRQTVAADNGPCPWPGGNGVTTPLGHAKCDFCHGSGVVDTRYKTDRLEDDEIDEAIVFLNSQRP